MKKKISAKMFIYPFLSFFAFHSILYLFIVDFKGFCSEVACWQLLLFDFPISFVYSSLGAIEISLFSLFLAGVVYSGFYAAFSLPTKKKDSMKKGKYILIAYVLILAIIAKTWLH